MQVTSVVKLVEVEVAADADQALHPADAEQVALQTMGEGWLVADWRRHTERRGTVVLAEDLDWCPF